MLRRYLSLQPTPDDQAWARWHIVDCLSLAGDAYEAIKEQQAFLQWACITFPLQDCFFVLADGTQARSWLTSGCGDDWLCLYHEFASQAPSTAKNRLDRFYCLRTAVHQCLWLGDLTRARFFLSGLHDLEQEDFTWIEQSWIKVEISILNIATADKSGNTVLVRTLARIATKDLEEWERHLNTNELGEVKRFRSLSHNIAAPLYRGKQYDLAIPLFQKAVKYHTNPPTPTNSEKGCYTTKKGGYSCFKH